MDNRFQLDLTAMLHRLPRVYIELLIVSTHSQRCAMAVAVARRRNAVRGVATSHVQLSWSLSCCTPMSQYYKLCTLWSICRCDRPKKFPAHYLFSVGDTLLTLGVRIGVARQARGPPLLVSVHMVVEFHDEACEIQ